MGKWFQNDFIRKGHFVCCTTRWQNITVTWYTVAKKIGVLLICRLTLFSKQKNDGNDHRETFFSFFFFYSAHV